VPGGSGGCSSLGRFEGYALALTHQEAPEAMGMVTSGASESALAERQVAESGTARTHRATQRATRRSRTGDQVVADPADDDLAGVEADASRWLRGSSHRRWRLSVTQLPETSEVYPSD
jgi:microcystin degradation protein MlrC